MTVEWQEQCRFVLVGTSHAGNIGAAARAMKTMGIGNLDLVTPACEIDDQALAMAAGARDVVESALVHDSLAAAVAESTLVIGLTARPRRDGVPALDPAGAADCVLAERGSVSMLFGRERTGLTNDELASCHRLVHIPANPEYPSLNLAAAVQIMAYELYHRGSATVPSPAVASTAPGEPGERPASGRHLEGLHAELAALVEWSGYAAGQPDAVLQRRLRNFINRARPSVDEVNLLRGILKRVHR